MFKNALVSVSDKTGLADFLKPFVDRGMRLVSTGGTAEYLREHGYVVNEVSEQTKFPEVMNGRVKTLHPYIHMGLLARGYVAEDMHLLEDHGLEPFDLVIGNLYPFAKKFQEGLRGRELVEFIDIGGPSFLRSAAKNFERICVVCDPSDYSWIYDSGELSLEDRKSLASKVFYHTSSYDSIVAQSLFSGEALPKEISFSGQLVRELRYGENPQQRASWYAPCGASQGLHNVEIIQGKALSYNNLLDFDAALATLKEFDESPCCVSVKHNNPCGVGLGEDILQSIDRSLAADPMSVFGGIVAVNKRVDREEAEKLTSLFLEVVVAPEYSSEAMDIFKKKKNLRVLKLDSWGQGDERGQSWDVKTIHGGFLVQSEDVMEDVKSWEFIGKKPSPALMETLLLAWKVVMKLKSNGIAIAQRNQTVGLGMGQVNRVDAVIQAIGRMEKFHPEAREVVLASDAFFPFSDSIEVGASHGVKWFIQPGGAIRDSEVMNRAKELGVNMVLTKARHFLH